MADADEKIEFHKELFELDHTENQIKNKRKTTRYIRKDVNVSLAYRNSLGLKRNLKTELNDISSRGVLVTTPKKIGFVKKITIVIQFNDSQVFRISGRIVRQCPQAPYRYGIRFEKQENDLGDYLLKTQTDLTFK